MTRLSAALYSTVLAVLLWANPANGDSAAKEIRIDSVASFLAFVDLKHVYMEAGKGGSPAFFLALPGIGTPIGEDPQSGAGKLGALGYFYKVGTGLAPDRPYDDSAPARPEQAPFDYACFRDNLTDRAKLDVLELNTQFAPRGKEPRDPGARRRYALERLRALGSGLRYTVFQQHAGIQTNCGKLTEDSGNAIDVITDYFFAPQGEGPEHEIQTYARWEQYQDGDEGRRKADALVVKGPGFGEHVFIFRRSRGMLGHHEKLIQWYRWAGFDYVEY